MKSIYEKVMTCSVKTRCFYSLLTYVKEMNKQINGFTKGGRTSKYLEISSMTFNLYFLG